jgi:hypothetical protein
MVPHRCGSTAWIVALTLTLSLAVARATASTSRRSPRIARRPGRDRLPHCAALAVGAAGPKGGRAPAESPRGASHPDLASGHCPPHARAIAHARTRAVQSPPRSARRSAHLQPDTNSESTGPRGPGQPSCERRRANRRRAARWRRWTVGAGERVPRGGSPERGRPRGVSAVARFRRPRRIRRSSACPSRGQCRRSP